MKSIMILMGLLTVSLTGCVDLRQNSSGVEIEKVRVDGQLEYEMTSDAAFQAQMTQHLKTLIEMGDGVTIEIVAHSSDGETLAKRVRREFYRLGGGYQQLSHLPTVASNHTDLTLYYHYYDVQTPVCAVEQVKRFDHSQLGCSTEAMRYKSMTTPD